jgi:hypothetical protein
MHDLVVSDDLDGDLLTSASDVPGPDHVTEDALEWILGNQFRPKKFSD